MKMSLKFKSVAVKLGFSALVAIAVLAVLFAGPPETAEAAKGVILGGGMKLNVKPNGCNLIVTVAKKTNVKVMCQGWTPTPDVTPTGESATLQAGLSDAAESAQEAQIKVTLTAGKALNIVPNNCTLQVKTNTPTKVAVTCVASTKPTKTPPATPIPPKDGKWVGQTNYGRYVYFEVWNDGKVFRAFQLRTYGQVSFGLWCAPYIFSSESRPIHNNHIEIKQGTSTEPVKVEGDFKPGDTIQGTYLYTAPTDSVCGQFTESGTWTATLQ